MNLHYAFWVEYYRELLTKDTLSAGDIDGKNQELFRVKWESGEEQIPMSEDALYFSVEYPGLLTGLGYSHEIGSMAEKDAPAISLGIHLDTVTGLPYIPGSQVKGLLRSAFIQNPAVIKELLGLGMESDADIVTLENQIFGKKHPYDSRETIFEDTLGTDVFLDAYPVKATEAGKLIGLENITPHRADDPDYDGLVDPTPLTLVKILPGVVMQFRFKLTDSTVGQIKVTAGKKRWLFRELLEMLGAGAKTNVGFGLLTPIGMNLENAPCYLQAKPAPTATAPQNSGRSDQQGQQQNDRPRRQPQAPRARNASPAFGPVMTATVTGIQRYGAFVKVEDGRDGMVHISEIADRYVDDVGSFLKCGDVVNVVEVPSNKPGKYSFSIKKAGGLK